MRREAALTAGIGILLTGCQSTIPVVVSPAPRVEAAPSFPVRDQECLALAMYWEARGEGDHGMTAVGFTVMNRVAHPAFPATPCAVVYEGGETPPCQFSWYCDGRSDRPRDWSSWQSAMRIAARLLTRPSQDPTSGALYFHSDKVDSAWHRRRERTARLGGHVFYR